MMENCCTLLLAILINVLGLMYLSAISTELVGQILSQDTNLLVQHAKDIFRSGDSVLYSTAVKLNRFPDRDKNEFWVDFITDIKSSLTYSMISFTDTNGAGYFAAYCFHDKTKWCVGNQTNGTEIFRLFEYSEEEGVVGEFNQPHHIDNRNREWYVRALAQPDGLPVWNSPILLGQPLSLTIQLSQAFFDPNNSTVPLGAISVNYVLDFLQRSLDNTDFRIDDAESFIMDGNTGYLYGSSVGSISTTDPNTKQSTLLLPSEQESDIIKSAGDAIKEKYGSYLPDETRNSFYIKGRDWYLAFERYNDPHGLELLYVVVVPTSSYRKGYNQAQQVVTLTTVGLFIVLLVRVCCCGCFVRHVMNRYSSQLRKIGKLRLGKVSIPDTMTLGLYEFSLFNNSLRLMVQGLINFSKFVPRECREIVLSKYQIKHHMTDVNCTVFFVDLVGFTSMTERLDPEELVEVLYEFFETVTRNTEAFGGEIDKFIGDCVFSYFTEENQHQVEAVKCCQNIIYDFMRSINMNIRVHVGLATGNCLIGCCGSSTRFTYTLYGDMINQASRIMNLCSKYGRTVLMGQSLGSDENVQNLFNVDVAARNVVLRGKVASQDIYTLIIGRKDDFQGEQQDQSPKNCEDDGDENKEEEEFGEIPSDDDRKECCKDSEEEEEEEEEEDDDDEEEKNLRFDDDDDDVEENEIVD